MKRWRTLSETKVEDMLQFVREAASDGQVVHIGTDSLQTGNRTQFCTVIAILNPGKGGRAIYTRVIVPRIHSLRERLLKEAWMSVEVGMELATVVPGELTVHVDANPEEKHMSSRYVQELVGLVVSQGFKVHIKPDSWCASHLADHVVRHHGKLPRLETQPVLKTGVA
jgi:uncharacterized protein